MKRLLKRISIGCALAFAVLTPAAAFAADGEIPPDATPVAVASDAASVVFSAPQWDLITGTIAPFAIWLLTKVGARYKVALFTTVVVTVIGTILQRALVLPDGSAIVSTALLFEALGIGGIGQIIYKLFKGGRAEKLLLPNVGFA